MKTKRWLRYVKTKNTPKILSYDRNFKATLQFIADSVQTVEPAGEFQIF
jgi:hypothetical protein